MALDRRHKIIEQTRVIGLIERSNDYAIYSFPLDAAMVTVPFNGSNSKDRALTRAMLLYSFIKEQGWR